MKTEKNVIKKVQFIDSSLNFTKNLQDNYPGYGFYENKAEIDSLYQKR